MERESYVYDNNIVSMSKAGDDYFYMLDELGTGMYLTGTDGTVSDTYAYDEFGRSLDPCTGKEKPQYQKQGNILQPLAFTGYQTDEMTESYFAQARFYNAGNGRLVSEDTVRGYKIRPDSINHYLYCYNMPIKLVDLNGREPIDDEFVPDTNEVSVEDAKHPIIVVGVSDATTYATYLSGGAQLVIDPALIFTDPLNCIGVQGVGGVGAGAGVSGGVTVYAGTLWAEKISWTEGYGTEVGGCLGLGVIGGTGMWIAGEADDPQNRFGGYIAFGAGASAEGHITMSYATKTLYPLQELYNLIMPPTNDINLNGGKKAGGAITSALSSIANNSQLTFMDALDLAKKI